MNLQCPICMKEFVASEQCACPYCGNARTNDMDPPSSETAPAAEESKDALKLAEEKLNDKSAA